MEIESTMDMKRILAHLRRGGSRTARLDDAFVAKLETITLVQFITYD